MSTHGNRVSSERLLTAAVLCSDDTARLDAWERVLRQRFQEIWLSLDGRVWRNSTVSTAVAPQSVDALFWHEGDPDLEGMLSNVRSTQVFLFNEAGTPGEKGRYLPILRRAGTSIDLTAQDIDEIADYVLHPQARKDIPSCCTLPVIDYLEPALAILCQGYLVAHACADQWNSSVHAESSIGPPYGRALSAMGWDSFSRDGDVLARLRELVDRGSEEEAAKGLCKHARGLTYWGAVKRPLRDIVSGRKFWKGGAEGYENVTKLAKTIAAGTSPVSDVEMVAKAYLEIRGRLAARDD